MQKIAAILILAIIRLSSWFSIDQVRALGRWIGSGLAAFPSELRHVTAANIRQAFPTLSDEEHRRLVRASIQHTATFALEAGLLWHWPLDRCERSFVRIVGSELLEAQRPQNTGVIVLVPHFGNWEVLALYLGRFGYTCLYDPPRLTGLEKPMRRARSRTGGQLVPIGNRGIKAMLKALRAGNVTALLPDQVPDVSSGVYADFFGRPTLTMTLAQRLLLQTEAQAVIGSAMRTEGGFEIRFERPRGSLADPDATRAAQALNEETMRVILRDPAQYQWEYRRFKRPPPGLPRLYD